MGCLKYVGKKMIKKFYKIVAVVMIVACPLIPQLANAESLRQVMVKAYNNCLLYTSDAADE